MNSAAGGKDERRSVLDDAKHDHMTTYLARTVAHSRRKLHVSAGHTACMQITRCHDHPFSRGISHSAPVRLARWYGTRDPAWSKTFSRCDIGAFSCCTAWVKKSPCGFQTFSPNSWEFLINFLHTYYTFISTLDCKFSFNQLSPILTKLSHTKRDHPSNFWANDVTVDVMSYPIQHVCWHYKSSRSGMTCHKSRSTNVWTRAFRPMVDILSILRALNMA